MQLIFSIYVVTFRVVFTLTKNDNVQSDFELQAR